MAYEDTLEEVSSRVDGTEEVEGTAEVEGGAPAVDGGSGAGGGFVELLSFMRGIFSECIKDSRGCAKEIERDADGSIIVEVECESLEITIGERDEADGRCASVVTLRHSRRRIICNVTVEDACCCRLLRCVEV